MNFYMDNFGLDVTAHGREALGLALSIAHGGGGACVGFAVWRYLVQRSTTLQEEAQEEAEAQREKPCECDDSPRPPGAAFCDTHCRWHTDQQLFVDAWHRVQYQREDQLWHKGADAATCWEPAGGLSYVPALVLFAHPSPQSRGFQAFPSPLKGDALLAIVDGWLDDAEYPDQPDHDGSNSQGWRVFNENWGHIGNDHSAYLAIIPAWAMHGK